MRVLIACEFSGVVRRAFRALGHDAWSCDFLAAEDGAEHHFQCDVREVMGTGWDVMIAHPPCTYLAASGLHWNRRRPEREALTLDAVEFVRTLLSAPIPRIALENPVGRISTAIRRPDQVIHPWQFGHDESKATCLWLVGLAPLVPTAVVPHKEYACACGARFDASLGKYGCPNCCGDRGAARPVRANQTGSGQNRLAPSRDRWKERSRTYPGIAAAMAAQWGGGGA